MSLRELKNQVIEIPALICLILTGFKLSGSIIAVDWSWWIVVSPLLIWVLYSASIGFNALLKLSRQLDKSHQRHVKENAF